ncbi:hypothetical protein Aduo_001694 [Ancylostoma duodenale]
MAKRSEMPNTEDLSQFTMDAVDIGKLNICTLCDDVVPPLDEPEDAEIMIGAPVLWWCCTKCKTWAHRDCNCMQSRECVACCEGEFQPTG